MRGLKAVTDTDLEMWDFAEEYEDMKHIHDPLDGDQKDNKRRRSAVDDGRWKKERRNELTISTCRSYSTTSHIFSQNRTQKFVTVLLFPKPTGGS
jgi:hypothetical protein